MPTDTVWKQAFAETGHATDAPNWTLGLEGSVDAGAGNASVTAFWWSPPVGASGTVGWRIYSGHLGEANALLSSGNLPAYTAGGGWQRFPITAQDVTGINFQACLYTSANGDYAFRNAPGFPVDDGTLTSAQSTFKASADAAPDNGSALSYMFDFEVLYGEQILTLGTVTETSTVFSLGRTKARALGMVLETDIALALTRPGLVGAAYGPVRALPGTTSVPTIVGLPGAVT